MCTAIQRWSSSAISSVVIDVQSKTRDDVIFKDSMSKRYELMFVQKIAQVISSYSFQDIFVSDFINSSYSYHVAVAACAKGIYLFLHHFCNCPGFSILEND